MRKDKFLSYFKQASTPFFWFCILVQSLKYKFIQTFPTVFSGCKYACIFRHTFVEYAFFYLSVFFLFFCCKSMFSKPEIKGQLFEVLKMYFLKNIVHWQSVICNFVVWRPLFLFSENIFQSLFSVFSSSFFCRYKSPRFFNFHQKSLSVWQWFFYKCTKVEDEICPLVQ